MPAYIHILMSSQQICCAQPNIGNAVCDYDFVCIVSTEIHNVINWYRLIEYQNLI